MRAKELGTGYWHIRGQGPCDWTQPPYWPCSEEMIREHAFCQAGEMFLEEVIALSLSLMEGVEERS